MKNIISYFILIIFVLEINSLLPPEKREELLNKYAKKITPENLNSKKDSFNYNYLKAGFKYEVKTINAILEQYNFNQNYSFLEEHNIAPNVKDQQSCGCCWSHAVTTALAYRFKLKGLNLDLSPQDALSCYLRDCGYGNYLIDPQLNLIKNGTVTEQCLPFSSGNGIITADCPVKCVDGSNIKKYYSQNAYMTEETVTQGNYYDIVLLIIDQLVNKGPVVAGITVYKDFTDLSKDENCPNSIYRYNGKAEELGGHAVAVVGYGFMDGKYYWLIQNSWGPNSCDNGFIKIEFGQIGIENVAFGDPYLEEEGKNPVELKIKYNKLDGYCNTEVSLENTADISKWKNSFELNFKSEDERSNFNFQCGILSSEKVDKKIACYYEYMYQERQQNFYKYKGFKSLGKDNTFNLGSSTSEIKDFNFYGYDTIYPFLPGQFIDEQKFFVSEEGSRIILYFDDIDTWKENVPSIYVNYKAEKPLSDCKRKIFETNQLTHNLIICNIKSNEIDYFEEDYKSNRDPMLYAILCGAKKEINAYGFKLNRTESPSFRFKNIYLEKTEKLSSNTNILLEMTINGSLTAFDEQVFIAFSDIEYDNKNETYILQCLTSNPNINSSETNMTCQIQIEKNVEKNYYNLYIHPYIIPFGIYSAYEIIIPEVLKKENEFNPKPDPRPVGVASNLKSSLIFAFLIALLI